MRNLLWIAFFVLISCSTSDDECEPQTDALIAINKMYQNILDNTNLPAQQRGEIIAEHEREVAFYEKDPCTYKERKWPEE